MTTATDTCPVCAGRGAKWLSDERTLEVFPQGRPETVRDLHPRDQARARRYGLNPTSVWPCVRCDGFGYLGGLRR